VSKFGYCLSLVFMTARLVSATPIAPPCQQDNPFGFPVDPSASLEPVPASGTFSCGGVTFSDFSSNILDGGLIGASWVEGFGLNPFDLCCGSWPSDVILLEVQPVSPEGGWSYVASGTSSPLVYVGLPALNHVTSGNPTVTESGMTASETSDGGYIEVPGVIVIQVSSITGGTISALDTIFVTPEPMTILLMAVGLGFIAFYRRHSVRLLYRE
jgi:hypothetical protein